MAKMRTVEEVGRAAVPTAPSTEALRVDGDPEPPTEEAAVVKVMTTWVGSDGLLGT